jgi:hypothetical protein
MVDVELELDPWLEETEGGLGRTRSLGPYEDPDRIERGYGPKLSPSADLTEGGYGPKLSPSWYKDAERDPSPERAVS